MNVVIVDDEPGAISTLTAMLTAHFESLHILASADNVQDAFDKIVSLKPDLVFLDIRIGNKTCFDLLNLFEVIDFEFIIISGYDSYGIDAVKANALDYLVKPINYKELVIAVNKAIDLISKRVISNNKDVVDLEKIQSARIIISTSHSEKIILRIRDIVRCTGEKNYTTFCLISGKEIVISRTLKEFELKLLPSGFIRVFQSQLVNILHINSVSTQDGNTIKMVDGKTVPVSRERKGELMDAISRYTI